MTTTTIPTIDISPFLPSTSTSTSPSPPLSSTILTTPKLAVLTQIRNACLSHGFFLITGHGVSRELQQQTLEWSKRLFDLPMAQKMELEEGRSFGRSHRGYQVLGGEAYEEGQLPDLKEGFQIGVHKDISHPDCQSQRMLSGPNIYPASLEPGFSTAMTAYFTAVSRVSHKLMELLALTLNIDYETHFGSYINDSLQAIRLLHYPPARRAELGEKQQLGTGAHTDFGAVTVLLTDGIAGLQVWKDGEDGDGGEWMDVKADAGDYVVNLGDMYTAFTAGLYKSSLHRVVNTTPNHRYSIPAFLDGNLDAVVKSIIDGPTPELKGWTVEEHMTERFRQARIRARGDSGVAVKAQT